VKLVTVLACLAAVSAQAQKIAVLDSERVFDALGEVADARELLQTEIDEWQAHADSLQADIDAITLDLDRTLMMSPERRREREALLADKKRELEEFVASTYGPGGQVERRNSELVAPVIARINEAVREIATRDGYDLVLDAAGGFVVFATDALDITDEVIEQISTTGSSGDQPE
jgi:outer membrane protein